MPAVITTDDIREAVAQVLGHTVADDDDLIQAGLDSIRMMRLAGRWRKAGADVNFAQLAEVPSIAAWERLLAAATTTAATPGDAAATPGDAAASAGDPAGFAGGAAAAAEVDAAHPNGADPAAQPADPNAPFPLAPMQHAYWIGREDTQELGGVAAHLYVEFDGPALDPAKLSVAVDALVQRHPMLRAQVLPDGTQRILDRPPLPVFTVDDDADLDAVRERKTHQKLRIDAGQVLDVTLSSRPDGGSRLHLDIDMHAADAMSYRALVAELAAVYHGKSLPPIGYRYADYVTSRPQPTAKDRQWWTERLDELPAAPELPLVPVADRTAPNTTVRHHHWISPSGKQRLLAAAHARGVTPAMALASVFAESIGRWCAQPRFLLNLPLFARRPVHPDIDSVVGDFSSSVLLDVDVSAPATVAERALELQKTMHRNGSHASFGALDVLRELGRRNGEQVLAPIVYTSALNLGELFADTVLETFGEPVWIISQGPQVLLDAQVTEVRGGLLLNWDVRENAFRPGVVDAMFARYVDAVSALGETDDAWDRPAAPLLPAAQLAQRARVNATAGVVRGGVLHHGLFERADSDAPAIVWGTDGACSYRDLAAKALTIAGYLRANGIDPGAAVGVQLPKGPDQIVAVCGVLAAGCVYVPIGHDQPVQRRAAILETGDVATVLDLEAALAHPNPLAEPVFPDPGQAAYVLFTSGSTGVPKGVEVSHAAALNTIADFEDRFAVGPTDRTLGQAALEFDISVYDIFAMLAVGGAVVAVAETQRADADAWLALMHTHEVSVLTCVPSVLDMVLSAGPLPASLRACILGGDWVDPELATRLAAQLPDCRFVVTGGATELAVHCTVCEVDADRWAPEVAGVPAFADWMAVPYGTPLRNVVARVVDPAGRDCADWVTGELWVGGGGVAIGYRNDPDRTAARFVDYDGQRWYRTGDLARYWPDGTLEFCGRADHQVKVRGHRVELGEVEGALRALPECSAAVAAVVGNRLGAVVTATATAELLRERLADALPPYMIPDRIVVVTTFPLTGNGKLDRAAVAALLAAEVAPDSVAPRTGLEAALVHIVGGVLDRTDIGVTDDFLALGGDSVLATATIARIRDWLDAPQAVVADIFVARTVAELAQRLDAKDETPGRLQQVAQVYLEVAAMSDAELGSAVPAS